VTAGIAVSIGVSVLVILVTTLKMLLSCCWDKTQRYMKTCMHVINLAASKSIEPTFVAYDVGSNRMD